MPAFSNNFSHFKDRAVETDLDFIDKIGEKHFYSRDPSLSLHLSIFLVTILKGVVSIQLVVILMLVIASCQR